MITPYELSAGFAEVVAAVLPVAGERPIELSTEVWWTTLHGMVVLTCDGRLPPAGAGRSLALIDDLFRLGVGAVRSGSMAAAYVHGYEHPQRARLRDQAGTLVELLHHDTRFEAGSRVLEAGCGVGAQTVTLARQSPEAQFTSVDISPDSITAARARAEAEKLDNVTFQQADILALPFPDGAFDHVFVCFVLEHLARPVEALRRLARLLRPGGTMTVIEGDHGSAYFYPESEAARAAIACQVELQQRAGGDALIGRRLYPLLIEAGLTGVRVSARMVYVDASRPDLVDGFTTRTFAAMIEGVRGAAIAAGLIEPERFDAGVRDLYRTTEADGVFCYCFFKAVAECQQPVGAGGVTAEAAVRSAPIAERFAQLEDVALRIPTIQMAPPPEVPAGRGRIEAAAGSHHHRPHGFDALHIEDEFYR